MQAARSRSPQRDGLDLDGKAIAAALADEVDLVASLDIPVPEAGAGPVRLEHRPDGMRDIGLEEWTAHRLIGGKREVIDAGQVTLGATATTAPTAAL